MSEELEVINMITTGVIPKMSSDDRSQMERDIRTINAERFEENAPELYLDKTFDEHFLVDAVDVCNNRILLDYSDDDSLDNDLFSTINFGSESEDEINTTNEQTSRNDGMVPVAQKGINLIDDEKIQAEECNDSNEIW